VYPLSVCTIDRGRGGHLKLPLQWCLVVLKYTRTVYK
jgi:hypothetical protein